MQVAPNVSGLYVDAYCYESCKKFTPHDIKGHALICRLCEGEHVPTKMESGYTGDKPYGTQSSQYHIHNVPVWARR